MEHKSDEEIKRCIKICSANGECDGCSYTSPERSTRTCTDYLLMDALHLINKLERKIITLNDEHSEQLIKLYERLGKAVAKCQDG